MTTDELFIKTFEDICQRLNSDDEYSLIIMAGLVRKLVLDGGGKSLFDQVKSKSPNRKNLNLKFQLLEVAWDEPRDHVGS